ncbi:hypothetical protein GCM10009839_73310 [Catenulispora yoronensis]|uniref:Serpin domain-containing protein n=1 Tax=Catenulispora yoronensis TaxID=450799 RepID=A0ABN2V8G4_9ACTN
MTATAVEKVNALTKRWLETWAQPGPGSGPDARASSETGSGATVLSGAGVWPLLAFLADGADDTGRAELASALGVPADEAARAARDILATIESSAAARIALGLWTRREVRVHTAWLANIAPGVHGELTGDAATDQKRLDAWTSEHTGGLVPRLPVTLTADIMLVLASALTVEVTWQEPFRPSITETTGEWADENGQLSVLRRHTTELRALRVADTPAGRMSALTVDGDGDVDVVLVLGPEDCAPAKVIAAGTDLAASTGHDRSDPSITHGPNLPVGTPAPGVTVSTVESMTPMDSLSVTTVPFRVSAHHDLLEHAALFGLRHVSGPGRGHFPGLSDFPLTVDQAAQDAVAVFTAKGFTAAAVMAFAMMAGSAMRPSSMVRQISVTFDRPFAYYAVHRASGLILVAGWVGAPDHEVSSGNA